MVGITFARPVGPYADTKELEYISALHQTDSTVRPDGSIRAEDIQHFLSSRHGVRVEEEIVMANIVLELGGSLPIPDKKLVPQGVGDIEEEDLGNADKKTGGGEEEDEEEEEQPILDICQIMAMLMIPFFRKGNVDEDVLSSKSNLMDAQANVKLTEAEAEAKLYRQQVVAHVLDIALRNILAEFKTHAQGEAENHGMVMTTKVLRQVLEIFGEYDVPEELLEEMIDQAQIDRGPAGGEPAMNPNEVFFNKATFLHALTADTQLYDPEIIDYRKSTHFDDARLAKEFQQLTLFGANKEFTRNKRSSDIIPQHQQDGQDGNECAVPFEVIYTASNLDNTADTYRSTSWFTLVWVETVLIYFGYMVGKGVQITIAACTVPDPYADYNSTDAAFIEVIEEEQEELKKPNEFGCAVAKSLVGWLAVFTQLMFMGFSWVWMATFGNTTHPTETICAKLNVTFRLLVGMGVVSFVCILSFFKESNTSLWNTYKKSYTLPANWGAFLGGIAIIGFQLNRLLGLYIPLGFLNSGGMEKKEQTIKKAACFKVFSMVEHAMLLHGDPSSNLDSMRQSSVSPSVLEFASSLYTTGAKKSTKKSTIKNDLTGTTNKALLNFHRIQEAREETGGIVWFLKRAWDRTIFEQEGIYLHGRLISVNVLQFFIAALIISTCIFVVTQLDQLIGYQKVDCTVTIGDGNVDYPDFGANWNSTQDGYENIFNINETHWSPVNPALISEVATLLNITSNETDWSWYDLQPLIPYLPAVEGNLPKFDRQNQNFLLPGGVTEATLCVDSPYGFFTINATGAHTNEAAAHNQFLEALGLKEHEWKGALAGGVIAAFVAILSIAATYIPSFTSSVLKLRSGVSPSLKADPEQFANFRRSPDSTQYLFGVNFWGCFYTAFFTFFLMALLIFVCVWDLAWTFVKQGIAIALGAGTTIVVKIILMKVLRGKFYSSFYRKRPAASNILNVILECYALATSSLVVTSRLIKLIVVSALYVGRVDTPMLAPGVVNLDAAPTYFTIDLLSHEAHRHPYIERLGLLYLLKLYNGKKFGTRAGAYWRMLFVLALMPWMRNYRIRSESVLPDDEEDEDDVISIRRQVQNEVDGTRRRDSYDMFGTQLEMDLTRKAYDKVTRRNKELRAALIIARDKVRELKAEKKALKKQLQASKSVSSRKSSRKSMASPEPDLDNQS